ncbi:hypothetical protein P7C71_g3944, partial [Lecanoromycetidae sp. Uapishka_2]
MECLEELSAEVCRVVESPFTPDLKGLHKILQDADPHQLQLQRWGRANGCKIDSLAGVTLDGLELWPYALDILRILGTL